MKINVDEKIIDNADNMEVAIINTLIECAEGLADMYKNYKDNTDNYYRVLNYYEVLADFIDRQTDYYIELDNINNNTDNWQLNINY